MQPLGENSVNTPAFLGKLWKMVNDPATDHLILWSPSGTSFIIQNQALFWYDLLPVYYKHNNMSSFVRQLNMYGFHKMSSVDNGGMESEKDEIQFSHPYFQKDKPELLRLIKRKVTAASAKASLENNSKIDPSKLWNDIKQLRGRQSTVDIQLNAMKQENALLWREVATLRQKHLKQQKIVNKLIQFLVTLVQPSRISVSVKRGYQLMLHESPAKKTKTTVPKSSSSEGGPTIHELDSDLEIPLNLYEEPTPLEEEEENAELKEDTINSPGSSAAVQAAETSPTVQLQESDDAQQTPWPQKEFVSPDFLDRTDLTEENLMNTLKDVENENFDQSPINDDRVFLSPSAPNTLLTDLIKENDSGGKDGKQLQTLEDLSETLDNLSATTSAKDDMTVAKREPSYILTSDDLSNHTESTQTELDNLKDMLSGYNTLDADTLLGELNKLPVPFNADELFHEDSPPQYDLNMDDDKISNLMESVDPMVSGSELTPYGNNLDFNELCELGYASSDDPDDPGVTVPAKIEPVSTVNTPQILKEEPKFPTG